MEDYIEDDRDELSYIGMTWLCLSEDKPQEFCL
jgi:hypothetical protein